MYAKTKIIIFLANVFIYNQHNCLMTTTYINPAQRNFHKNYFHYNNLFKETLLKIFLQTQPFTIKQCLKLTLSKIIFVISKSISILS